MFIVVSVCLAHLEALEFTHVVDNSHELMCTTHVYAKSVCLCKEKQWIYVVFLRNDAIFLSKR